MFGHFDDWNGGSFQAFERRRGGQLCRQQSVAEIPEWKLEPFSTYHEVNVTETKKESLIPEKKYSGFWLGSTLPCRKIETGLEAAKYFYFAARVDAQDHISDLVDNLQSELVFLNVGRHPLKEVLDFLMKSETEIFCQALRKY